MDGSEGEKKMTNKNRMWIIQNCIMEALEEKSRKNEIYLYGEETGRIELAVDDAIFNIIIEEKKEGGKEEWTF